MPSLLNYLDYSSTDCLERVLKSYPDIKSLALQGYLAILDLYLELEIALQKLPELVKGKLLTSIELEDNVSIKELIPYVQEILLGK